jgi:hypothetical protein
MSGNFASRKPLLVTVMVYVATGRRVAVKLPVASVLAVRVTVPVS